MPRGTIISGLLAFASLTSPAAAQSADELVAKAKAEKEVVYYTELIVDQIVRPLAGAFERKYGIKVSYWRGDSQAAGLRLAMEHKAGRTQADVWSTSSGIGALLDAGLIERFALDNAAALGPAFRDPGGYWVATNMIVVGAAVNTGLVAEPRSPAEARGSAGAQMARPDGLEAERHHRRLGLHRQCAHHHGGGARARILAQIERAEYRAGQAPARAPSWMA